MIEKIKYLVKQLSKELGDNEVYEFIENSEIVLENHWNQKSFPNLYNVLIKAHPDVYVRYYKFMDYFRTVLENRIKDAASIMVDKFRIQPDHEKIQILHSEIEVIKTPWSEINDNQNKLIKLIQSSKESIDYQSVGLLSRTIMEKLADEVFNVEVHISDKSDPSKYIRSKYKNRLQAFIQYKVKGEKNKELRKFAKTSIDFTKQAIDLMNKTTHKLDAQKHFAEVCAISTISVISLIKSIKELD
ncbi:MAG: hypothetical protein ACLFNL_08250 [Bacteroidales bacterium]